MAITTSTNASDYYTSLISSINGASSSSKTSSATTDIESRFLKLLTTQLKNQDPLNPMENAEVTSQLAQISTVSGIEQLNSTLKTLLQGTVDGQTTQAASLVGQGVMVPGTALTLTSSAGVGGFVLDADADSVKVTISDGNGTALRTMTLGSMTSGLHNITWDGTTDSGEIAVDGNYTISVEATASSEKVTTTPLMLGVVRSVITGTNGFTLDLGSLGLFSMDDVKQIL